MPASPASPPLKSRNSPGRPKDLAKRAAILSAAKTLFMACGFEGVRMEQIAQNAGVSKLTLYSHFGDKEGLLVAVIKAACEQNLPPEFFQHCPEKPVRTHLLQLAEALFAISTSAESIALHCMLCSPNNPAPNLAALFWQAGPERTQQGIASLLRHWHEAGELAIENPEQAAEHLYVLIKGKIFTRQLLGLEGLPDTATAKRHVREAVDLFLRAYRP